MPENLLAIDNGTQSVRALLFDPQGNLLARERVPIEPYFSTAPGLAEQDPAVFWNALCAACKGLFNQKGVDASSDRRGSPHHPALHRPQPGRRWQTAAAGHRLAGSAPHRRADPRGRVMGCSFQGGRRQ